MAILATVTTDHGEERELYIRLNNMEASNHGVTSFAKFRGFVSQEAFAAGAHYLWERDVEFTANVATPLWQQAYEALKDSFAHNAALVADLAADRARLVEEMRAAAELNGETFDENDPRFLPGEEEKELSRLVGRNVVDLVDNADVDG